MSGTLTDTDILGDWSGLFHLTTLFMYAKAELQALPKALPRCLQHVVLNLESSNRGIPAALEALPNLQTLTLYMAEHRAHLDRPLSAFVAMARLRKMEFVNIRGRLRIEWRPEALKFIGQALAEIHETGSNLKLVW